MTMTQKEIADTLVKEFDFSVRQSQAVVARVVEQVKNRLASDDQARCELRGLGVFSPPTRQKVGCRQLGKITS